MRFIIGLIIRKYFANKSIILGQKMNIMITPVLLSGGSGERLWPLSRKSFPKQFLK